MNTKYKSYKSLQDDYDNQTPYDAEEEEQRQKEKERILEEMALSRFDEIMGDENDYSKRRTY